MMDTHVHLDLYPNPLCVIEETSRKNVTTLCVTTSPRAWFATRTVISRFNNIIIALGIHPEIVSSKQMETQMLLDNIGNSVFIGEVGLDGSSKYSSFYALQKSIFSKIIEKCVCTGFHVISIHSRNAVSTVLDILSNNISNYIPILHWFSGTQTQLTKAIDLGCFFSFGPAALSSANGRRLVSQIPLERLLPESDGPFTYVNNRMVMPWEAIDISSYLSNIHHCNEYLIRSRFISNWNAILTRTTHDRN